MFNNFNYDKFNKNNDKIKSLRFIFIFYKQIILIK